MPNNIEGIQAGTADTNAQGYATWTYPTPFLTAPIVVAVCVDFDGATTENWFAAVQNVTLTSVRAQVFRITHNVAGVAMMQTAGAGRPVNFAAFDVIG